MKNGFKYYPLIGGGLGGEALVGVGGGRAAHLDAAGAELVVEVGELVGVDVNVLDRELDVVLGNARGRARARDESVDDLEQVLGELDAVVGLLGSHMCPFDV